MASPGRGAVRHIEADLAQVVLVCRKCSKKLKGGFGEAGDECLAKALRRDLAARSPGARKRKALRRETVVMEVDCLDLCPKHAVVALRADRPGDWLLVPKGSSSADVLAHLGFGEAQEGKL